MTESTITLATIEEASRLAAEARSTILGFAESLRDKIAELTRAETPTILAALRAFNTAEAELRRQIDAAPALFEKPRTRTYHGFKVGYAKGKGGLKIEDPEKTIKLIKKHLPDQVDVLVLKKETPSKDAISNLPADVLKKIGVEIMATGDFVVLKVMGGDVQKLIDSLTSDEQLTEEAP